MGVEIEKKFLVVADDYRSMAIPVFYRQGYLNEDKERTVRVRIAGKQAFITIKGKNNGITRTEFEYEIPVNEATEMLDKLCLKPDIEKYRYRIEINGFIWEVDEFLGENCGLVLAEIELPSVETMFMKPEWIGEEVSGDARYYNSNLVRYPYSKWDV